MTPSDMPGLREEAQQLPRLRDDLELIDTQFASGACATRLIYDPLRHRFMRVDRGTFELMSLLNDCHDADDLQQKAWHGFSQVVDEASLQRFTEFIERSELADHSQDGNWRALADRSARKRKKVASRVIHNYIFFKVPLLRPQVFLKNTLDLARPFMSRTAALVVILAGVTGLYLVSRQWDEFQNTFHHAFTFQGAITFALALTIVKALHELGHAYVAVSYGCRVSSLGVAFMLMTPLLYTDVTDAWRLKDNKKRLAIDAAGIVVELSLAAVATFLWVFFPEGMTKSILFAIATVGWIMSLVFNLNPFMRFDGYYLLSDYLKVENLQPRAFAMARWHLRETLFDLRAQPPEVFTRKMRWTLITYAWATWVYRLVLFIGIALLVYALFFKLLGIALFVIEIAVFIAKPIWSEVREWIAMHKTIFQRKRTYISILALALSIAFLAVPWSTRIIVPALLSSDDIKQVYPPRPARVAIVFKTQGDLVARDQPLIQLHDPELIRSIELAKVRRKTVQMRLSRLTADKLDRAQSLVLRRELVSLTTRIKGLNRQQSELTIRAPLSGTVIEFNPHIHLGRWIARSERIALVGATSHWSLKGYVSEADIERLTKGATGTFIPDDPMLPTRTVTLTKILRAGTLVLEHPELASRHGGPVATRDAGDKKLVPVSAQFLATMHTQSNGEPLSHTQRGIVLLEGTHQSILARTWRQVLKVLVRESGI